MTLYICSLCGREVETITTKIVKCKDCKKAMVAVNLPSEDSISFDAVVDPHVQHMGYLSAGPRHNHLKKIPVDKHGHPDILKMQDMSARSNTTPLGQRWNKDLSRMQRAIEKRGNV